MLFQANKATCLCYFSPLSITFLPLFFPQWSHPSPGATPKAPRRKAKILCWGAHLVRAPTPCSTAGRRPVTTSCCLPQLCWVMDPLTSTPNQIQNSFQVLLTVPLTLFSTVISLLLYSSTSLQILWEAPLTWRTHLPAHLAPTAAFPATVLALRTVYCISMWHLVSTQPPY